tara:strand:+ start:718 stop:1002 length:285 start_codon:yes stop_codon:yes gene_type:complete
MCIGPGISSGTSHKLQASSLTTGPGSCRMNLERIYMTLEEIDTIDDKNGLILDMSKQNEKLMQDPMVRIANALEEILRLVKEDQEKMRKINEEN